MRALVVAAAIAVCLAAVVGRSSAAPAATECAPVPAYVLPRNLPHYRLDVAVAANGSVAGTERIQLRLPRATDRVVLRLWANGPETRAGGARLDVRVTSKPAGASVQRPSATELVLALGRLVPRNRLVTLALRFTLRLPPAKGLYRLAHGDGFVRLGSFFPLLALDADGRWATDPPSVTAAETWVSPTAEFDAVVRAPRGWAVAATGRPLAGNRWRANAVRDFAVVAGKLARATTTVRAPQPVLVTALAPNTETANAFAHRAAQSLAALSRLYGPYPWPRYSVAVFDDLGRSGIEYPNIVFQGSSSLERATAHEAAHQWFYSLVGNNQARDPWLDESLASWAMTRVDPATAAIARTPIPDTVRGKLTAPMAYWDQDPGEFFPGVYAQGYEAFGSLGPGERTDCALSLYVARNAYGVATVRKLVDALAERLPADALRRLASYG